MKKVRVKLGERGYEIHIGSGLLAQTGDELKKLGFGEKLVIITDPVVKKLFGNSLKKSLADSGFKVTVLEVPVGEEQKSMETATRLYQDLTAAYAERTTPILAMGGGVIGDLAGFVAATYLRGVPLVQIPTTLLAQVDSSIGGKVAVDYGSLKNRIGAFYQPRLVISDIDTLKTLPQAEISDGLAEIIKYGVISDAELFSFIENNIEKIKALDNQALEKVIYSSVKIKAQVVAIDERDFGLRQILNYGHTVGHAIESVTGFKVSHGQAVAMGMVIAARISNMLGFMNKNEVARLKKVISSAGLPTTLPELDNEKLLKAITHDKKVLQGKIKFILPKSIGEVFISEDVTSSLIEKILEQ